MTGQPAELSRREEEAVAEEDGAPEGDGSVGWDISGEIQLGDGTEWVDNPEAVSGPSTPLEMHEPEGAVPPAPLWAMKYRRHHLGRAGTADVVPIRASLGTGDDTIFFIEDGRNHCMVGRRVGIRKVDEMDPGCVYCLVGRVTFEQYEDVDNGTVRIPDSFSQARDISLCGVYEDEARASEVFLVQHYRHYDDVPPEYLPSQPFLEFEDDLSTEV